MRIECIVLEDHGDIAILGRNVVNDFIANTYGAVRDFLEPGNHAKRGRLPTARRADEHDEFAVLDVEPSVLNCCKATGIHF